MNNTHTAPVPAPVLAFRTEHAGHGRITRTPSMVVCHECHVWAPVPAEGGPMTCPRHPAFHADYCPTCGTAVVIGGTR
jgi:hypothetical protein